MSHSRPSAFEVWLLAAATWAAMIGLGYALNRLRRPRARTRPAPKRGRHPPLIQHPVTDRVPFDSGVIVSAPSQEEQL